MQSIYKDLLIIQEISSRENISEKNKSIFLQLQRNPTLVDEGSSPGKTASNTTSTVGTQAQNTSQQVLQIRV